MNESVDMGSFFSIDINYYLDMTKSVMEWSTFDDIGIPLAKYNYEIGSRYNPVTVSQYALGLLQLELKTSKKKFRQRFFKMVDWLEENLSRTKNGGCIWLYDFDNLWYNVKKPFISAMAQGEAISVFTRAYLLSENSYYKDIAEQAFIILKTPVEKGGVLVEDEYGICLEEIPSNPPSNILNGFIFAIFGINDLYLLTNEERYHLFFQKCIDSLENTIQFYDIGYWSIYDRLYKTPSSLNYHKLHIRQLKVLYDLTQRKSFLKKANTFHLYEGRPLCRYRSLIIRNMLIAKNFLKIAGIRKTITRGLSKIAFI